MTVIAFMSIDAITFISKSAKLFISMTFLTNLLLLTFHGKLLDFLSLYLWKVSV